MRYARTVKKVHPWNPPPPWSENSSRILRHGEDDGDHGGKMEVEVGRPLGAEQELATIGQKLVNL